jgi:hypothetical protein
LEIRSLLKGFLGENTPRAFHKELSLVPGGASEDHHSSGQLWWTMGDLEQVRDS